MAWFKVDDKFYTHPKALAAGLHGRAVWYTAGNWCADHLTDGHVPVGMLPLIFALTQIDQADGMNAVERLVQCRLWDEDTDGLGYQFHNWAKYQPSRDDVEFRRERSRKRGEIRSKAWEPFRLQIRARDGDVCRYCGITVLWQGGARSPHGGTFDHIDPELPNTVDNVVVACRGCNAQKKDRNPGEAGMVLRPIPGAKITPKRPPRPRPTARPLPTRPARAAAAPAPRTPRSATPAAAASPPRTRAPRKATGPPA